MPAFAVGDVLSMLVRCQEFGQAGIYTRHYRVTAQVDVDWTKTALANALKAQLEPVTQPLMTPDGSFEYVAIKKANPALHDGETRSTTAAVLGTAGGEPLPTQVSGIITVLTPLGGRKYRGRVYVPFPTEGMNGASGNPTTAYRDLLNDLADVLFEDPKVVVSGGNSITLKPVLYHRGDNTYTDVFSYRSNLKWATQKRRGIYGRPNPLG